MDAKETHALPSPPSLMAALMAGFDAIAGHISLILFPLTLDLLLWLGPRLRVERLTQAFSGQLIALSGLDTPETVEMLKANQELWQLVGERLNIMASLRTYPVGIPSLMTTRMPVNGPAGLFPQAFEIETYTAVFAIWFGLMILGLAAGVFYFVAVSQAAGTGNLRWSHIFRLWPRATMQTVMLTMIMVLALIAVSVPVSCMISAVALTNPALARFTLLALAGGLLWMAFPLLFSSHGIFVYHSNALLSIRNSIRIIRMTLPNTGLFFLAILIISQGMDVLWNVPQENSWFTLVGILGHAFIATALLAASFIYYRQADQWVQRILVQLDIKQTSQSKAS